MDFIQQYTTVWVILHLFALVLGLGGATYSDFLLFKFLKDYKIDKKEAEIIKSMSKIVTIGIILAAISGILLFAPEAERLLESSKFLTKVVAFVVLCINGFLLHHLVLPEITKFDFKKDHKIKGKIKLRPLGFAMGAISATSWYVIFILGTLKSIPVSPQVGIALYFGLLLGAVITSLLLEKLLLKRVG